MTQQAIADFQTSLRGRLIQPADSDYDAARALYNGMIDKRPRLIARCVDVADVIDAADVRVRDLPRDLDLVQKASPSRLVRLDVARQELQRDALPQPQVIGSVDLSHPAAAEQAVDPVSVRDDGSGKELPLIEGRRFKPPSGVRVRGARRIDRDELELDAAFRTISASVGRSLRARDAVNHRGRE